MKDKFKKQKTEKKKQDRVFFLDFLRGICILFVVFYHLSFDLHNIFGITVPYMDGIAIERIRDVFVGILICISGISCHFSRSNLKRGIRTLLIGLALTLATFLFYRDYLIVFGILHFFGFAMCLYALLEKPLKKTHWLPGLIVSMFFYLLTLPLFHLSGLWNYADSMPTILRYVFFILGFNTGLFSADYYPIMPNTFLFLAGVFIGNGFMKHGFPNWMKENRLKALSFIGRHTMLIYLLHQPILIGILYLLTRFL